MELVFRIVNRCSLFVAIFAASTMAIFACQIAPYKPFKSDPTEYVFIGEVTGYTGSVVFERHNPPSSDLLQEENHKQTHGLVVKVSEAVFIPKEQLEFEVFVYGMGAGCETLGKNLERLRNEFPIGARVIVIAQEAVQIPNKSKNGGARLEVMFPRGVIDSKVPGSSGATSKSIFDFSSIAPKRDGWTNRFTLGAFEVRKEMFSLEKASSEMEKSRILRRLLSIDYEADVIDLYGLTTHYSATSEDGKIRLLDKLVKDGVRRSHAQAFLKCSEGEDRSRMPFYSICPLPPRN